MFMYNCMGFKRQYIEIWLNRLVLVSWIKTACYVLLSASISHGSVVVFSVRSMHCFCNKKKQTSLNFEEKYPNHKLY